MKNFSAINGMGRCSLTLRMLQSASALAMIGLSAPALAQDPETPASPVQPNADAASKPPGGAVQGEAGVGDIVVTAERRSQRLQSVPISITAVTGAALASAGIDDVSELEQLTPGLIQPAGIGGGPVLQPFIRGIGSASVLPGIESSVALYIDSAYSGSKSLNIVELGNIERVEVLKGPQGTLYGRNATGGAINIITQQPSDRFKGTASFSYGRFDEKVEKGYVTGPLTPTLAASLSVVARQGGNYIHNLTTGKEIGGINALSLNGQLAWTPTDRLHVNLTGTFARRYQNLENNFGVQVPGPPPIAAAPPFNGLYSTDTRTRYLDIDTNLRTRVYQGSLRARYSLDTVDLVSITSYQKGTLHSTVDVDATSSPYEELHYAQPNRTFTQELQAVSTKVSPFQWIVGAYYFNSTESFNPFNLYFARAVSPTDYRYFTFQKTTAGSVYAQGTYKVGPDTNITAGLRYSTEKKSLDATLVLPTFGNLVAAGPITGQKRFNKPTWRLSVDHKLSTDVLAYASYNRGFKSGAFDPLDLSSTHPQAVKPEVLDAFEVGLKSQFADRKVQLNAAAYLYKYKDVQVERVQPEAGATVAVLENAASATLYGLDADVVVVPVPSLRLTGGFNLEHSRYDSFPDASATILGNGVAQNVVLDLTGQQVLIAPKLTFNVGGSYTVDLAPGALLFSVTYSHSSRYALSAGTTNFMRSYGLLNGSIAFTDSHDHYTVELWGRNLTNEEKIGQYAGPTLDSYIVRPPVSYGVTVSAKF